MTAPTRDATGSSHAAHAGAMLAALVEPFPGACARAVALLHGQPLWSASIGRERPGRGPPAGSETRFRIGSISKPLTGACAARLSDLGMLDLDRPVAESVHGLPDAWSGITTRHVLTCTSGIAHYSGPRDQADTSHYPCVRDALRRFVSRPLAHAPGERFTYSSYAYIVAALAMERACGLPYAVAMARHLFEPAGAVSLTPDALPLPSRRRASFLSAPGGSVVPAERNDLSGRLPGSGFVGTVDDLARVGAALAAPGILRPDTWASLASGPTLSDGSTGPWGLGWRERTDWDGRRVRWGLSHTTGSSGGLLVCEGIAFALIANIRELDVPLSTLQAIARPLLAAAAGRTLHPAHRLAGAYRLTSRHGAGVGTLRLSAQDRLTGEALTDTRGVMRVVTGFIDGRDGWIIAHSGGAGLYPIRVQRRGRETRATALRERG